MKGLKELKEIVRLLDNAYEDYYDTGEPINPKIVDEARDRLKELVPEKIYEVEVITVTSNYGKRLYDSYQFLEQEVSRASNSTSHSQARSYALMEINARRERLGMPAIKENQIDFLES